MSSFLEEKIINELRSFFSNNDDDLKPIIERISIIIKEHETKLRVLVLDPDKNLMNIFLDDCFMWDTRNRRLIYHHQNNIDYLGVHLLEDFDYSDIILYEKGFFRSDHKNYINTHKINYFNKKSGNVHFNDSSHVLGSVARQHKNFISEMINQGKLTSVHDYERTRS